MAYEIAKALLEQAKSETERGEAIRIAMRLGMPIDAIREYLDWLDMRQDGRSPASDSEDDEEH